MVANFFRRFSRREVDYLLISGQATVLYCMARHHRRGETTPIRRQFNARRHRDLRIRVGVKTRFFPGFVPLGIGAASGNGRVRSQHPCIGTTHSLPGHLPLRVNIYDRQRNLVHQITQS